LRCAKLLFALLLTLATPAVAEPIDPEDVTVMDGDTINVFHVQSNVRLVGFNAPESSNAFRLALLDPQKCQYILGGYAFDATNDRAGDAA